MQKILHPTHPFNAILLALSRLMERSGYYGLRSIILVYMLSETINMTKEQATGWYGVFTSATVIGYLIGGVIGDLVTGNRIAMITGSVMQALGAFSFCIPNENGILIGLLLVTMGGGLYSPNMTALFGRSYSDNKMLGAGYTLLYTLINLGSFVGVLIISEISEKSYQTGFLGAGIFLLCSTMLTIFSRDQKSDNMMKMSLSRDLRIGLIMGVAIITGVFWVIYDLSFFQVMNQTDVALKNIHSPNILFNGQMIQTILLMVVSVIAVIIWSFWYVSPILKLSIGFILIGMAIVLSQNLGDNTDPSSIIGVILVFALSEILIGPIIFMLISEHVSPKFQAITIASAFVAARAFGASAGIIPDNYSILVSLALSVFLGVAGMIIYFLFFRGRVES